MVSNMGSTTDRIKSIRQAEAKSHIEAYTNHELYSAGSWLSKPVKSALDILPCFDEYKQLRVLDLGSGIGRNAVAIARHFQCTDCQIDCVDILELAIEKLNDNADKYGVVHAINGIVSSIDDYLIHTDSYDLVLAISALEHINSVEAFADKLQEIRLGLRRNGIACLIVNSGVQESSIETGEERIPQFEVNIPTDTMLNLLTKSFPGWEVLKQTVVHQTYDIPRDIVFSHVDTDVVTYVVRKPA